MKTLTLLDSSPAGGFTEPLSVSEVAHFLALPEQPSDADYDLLSDFISGAREIAEYCQNRDLVRKRWRLTLDRFPGGMIELRAPLVSVELVRYKDSDGAETDLVENTDYVVDIAREPGVIEPPYGDSWPSFTAWPSSAVTIEFTSGFATDAAFWLDAGKRLKNGMRFLISEWYNNRLPFVVGPGAPNEYPFTVTAPFSMGALTRCP